MTFLLLLSLAQDSWLPTSLDGAPSPRFAHSAVWTGREMIVWGGQNNSVCFGDGAAYDPVKAVWRPLSAVNAPSARSVHSAVWTGTEMIIWGGQDSPNSGAALQTGGRYDPVSDTWTATTTTGAPVARLVHGAIWTGTEMIVWGGADSPTGTLLQTGGRYDPVADAWTATGTGAGVPAAMGLHLQFWTGTRMIVWRNLLGGGLYDPGTDSWSPMSTTGQPSYFEYAGTWTGVDLIVAGAGSGLIPEAARYDPGSDSWTPLAAPPLAAVTQGAVWSGREAIFLGFERGIRFDPVAAAWSFVAESGSPSDGGYFSLVWAGNQAILWGGTNTSTLVNSGGAYYPNGNALGTAADTGCLAAAGDAAVPWMIAGLALLAAVVAIRRNRGVLTLLAIASLALPGFAQDPAPPAPPQQPAPTPPQEPEPPPVEKGLPSDPYLVVPSVGVWFNGFRFESATPTGVRKLESGAMPALGLKSGFFVADPVFVQLGVEAAFGSDVLAFNAGADVGLRFDLGSFEDLDEVGWELDVYAGGLVSRLDLDVEDFADFDIGIGFRAGAALRARLNPDLAVETALEFRSLTYAWDGTGTGDDEARANGVALLLGFRWGF